jgi:hypothetical protein
MASLETLKEIIGKMEIKPEIIKQMIFDPSVTGSTYNGTVRNLLAKMEEFLTKEQCLAIMEEEGCCKDGDEDGAEDQAIDNAFFAKYLDKTLEEKIRLFNIEAGIPTLLNSNGTITTYFSGYQNGVHKGKTTCSCPHIIREVKDFSTVPITYCGCCAGNIKYRYKKALGIDVNLKEIVSSPLNSNGEKRCEFLFNVIKS